MDTESTWQPVLVILRNGGRLECECGAKAMIVIGDLDTRARDTVEGVDYWCQSCYHKAQQEEMEKE